MICQNCGSVLPDNAVTCDVCGVGVRKKGPGAAAQRLAMMGVGAGVGLAVVGALAVPVCLGSPTVSSSTQSAYVASDLVKQGELIVPVQASGLDVSGSRIAVHVKGLTSGGKPVDQDGFVTHEGKGLALEQGMYEVTAVGSPISSSGVLYNLPAAGVSVEVSAEGGSSYTTEALLALTPVDAASVTDDQIEAARAWILKDPERSSLADHLAESARQRRDAAQKAGTNAKREETGESTDAQSSQTSGDTSDSSDRSSDNSGQSDSSSYSNYDGGYDNVPAYYGGSATATQSSPESVNSSDTSGSATQQTDASGNATQQTDASGNSTQQADSSQNGDSGQQTDSSPSDSSSAGNSDSDSGSSDSSGSSSSGSESSGSSESSDSGSSGSESTGSSSGSEQGSSQSQPANGSTDAGGATAPATA